MAEITEIHNINGKYRIVFEQAASTKGVLGFKVEANGDFINDVMEEASVLLRYAQGIAPAQSSPGAII